MTQIKSRTVKRVTTKIEFPVNREHIDTGKCKIPSKCAIRQACIEWLDRIEKDVTNHYVTMTGSALRFSLKGYMWEVAPVPQKAINFIIDFDEELSVKPFLFRATAIRSRKKQHREDQESVNERRRERKASGHAYPDYKPRRRSSGLVRIPGTPPSA